MHSRVAAVNRSIAVVLVFLSLLTIGCSGSQAVTGTPPQPRLDHPFAAASAAAQVTITGTTTSIVSPTEFSYQTGSTYGHVPVLYSASMVVPSGTTIQVGQPVTVTGAFNGQHQLVATLIALGLSGSVTSIVSSTQFIYQTAGPSGHVPVLYTESIVVPAGSTIKVGQSVSVMGSFNSRNQLVATAVTLGSSTPPPSPTPTPSLSPTPTPSPTSVASGLYHIATWAADSAFGQGGGVSAANVNQLVTYAVGDDKSVGDCHAGSGCKSVFYLDPNHVWNNSPSSCVSHPDADVVAAASESWFVHDTGFSDAAHRVHGKDSSGCSIWEMNPNSAGLQAWWRNYLRTHANSYDGYLIDNDIMDVIDAGYFPSGGGCDPWPSYCTSTQEIASNAAEVAARANFVNAMSHSDGSPMHFFFQQASFNIPLDLSGFAATNRFVGLSCEGCVSTTASPLRPSLYASVLNEMAAVNATSGAYLLISKGNSPAGSATQLAQRMVTVSIAWLGYSEGHTIVRANLESNTNNLAIWPEELVYPAGPLQSMHSGAIDLMVQPGVWRREFRTCYQKGVPIGPCAVIVNANGFAVTVKSSWLQQAYRHIITLAGGDVLSGGTSNISGARFTPNVTTIQPSEGLLLAP